jgi:hypothetical protein
MKTSVNFSAFVDAFTRMDRMENFTYNGLRVLFDYLESAEEDTVEEYELDVVGLCCEFAADTLEDVAQACGINLSHYEDEEQQLEAVLEYINQHSVLCGVTDCGLIVYMQF